MDHRNNLKKYIKKVGGYESAAAILGCSKITLRSVCNGWRGVGKIMAEIWEEASGGQLLAKNMVWIKASKQPMVKSVDVSKDRIVTLKSRKPRARGRSE